MLFVSKFLGLHFLSSKTTNNCPERISLQNQFYKSVFKKNKGQLVRNFWHNCYILKNTNIRE